MMSLASRNPAQPKLLAIPRPTNLRSESSAPKSIDRISESSVALVDDYMAQQLWPGQDAVGQRLHFGGIDDTSALWITMVGVVGRVKP
jgi:hypothetical protein